MKSREEMEAERVYGWARPEVVAAALAEARRMLERTATQPNKGRRQP